MTKYRIEYFRFEQDITKSTVEIVARSEDEAIELLYHRYHGEIHELILVTEVA